MILISDEEIEMQNVMWFAQIHMARIVSEVGLNSISGIIFPCLNRFALQEV